MSWWNLGGLNPQYKDFLEKHPDKTMIGMLWALYWRFAILVIAIEILVIAAAIFLGVVFGRASVHVPNASETVIPAQD